MIHLPYKRRFHPKIGRVGEAQLEREIGKDQVENAYKISRNIHSPIPIMGTPCSVYKETMFPRLAGGGFGSLSDLIAEATSGKRQDRTFQKTGTAGQAAGRSNSLWDVGANPAAGGTFGAAAGGTIPTNATTGSLKQADPAGGDTLHFVSGWVSSSVAGNTLLLRDIIFGGTQSLNSTNTAWTGVPTRYTGTESVGNFFTCELTTVMSATATNLTVTYVDQAGNTAEAAAATALTASNVDNGLPLPTDGILALNSGDTGIRNFTNVQSSGGNTGVGNMVLSHAIAIMPCPIVSVWNAQDGINSAFNLAEIKAGACLSFLEMVKPSTTATTYSGQIIAVSG